MLREGRTSTFLWDFNGFKERKREDLNIFIGVCSLTYDLDFLDLKKVHWFINRNTSWLSDRSLT